MSQSADEVGVPFNSVITSEPLSGEEGCMVCEFILSASA